METNTCTMKIGSGLGDLLLEMAQTSISKGEPEKAIELYVNSLQGFKKEHAMSVLKNERVLRVDTRTQDMYLSDEDEYIQANKKKINNWDYVLKNKWLNICELKQSCTKLKDEFFKCTSASINNFNLIEYGRKINCIELSHLCARVIANNPFAKCHSSGENVWERNYDEYLHGELDYNREVFFILADYIKNITDLINQVVIYCKMYEFLYPNNMTTRIPYYSTYIASNLIEFFEDFLDTGRGYYHPMCNVEIYTLKTELYNKLLTINVGKEYYRYGVVKADVEDCYDAGWLAPDGAFYADCGDRSDMIHLNIAQKLFACTASPIYQQMIEDGVTAFGSSFEGKNPESWLERKGWIKIHDNEVYGHFDEILDYCEDEPTDAQIDFICRYIQKHFNGKFYNTPQFLEKTEPITVYALKQMDKFALRKIFN